jgi:stage V sporulation protein AE
MIFLYAFLVGGLICMLAQVILDLFELTPGVVTAIFVSLGSFLDLFDLYDKLILFAGAGALTPITSFGHSLADAAYKAAIEGNYLDIFKGMFSNVSSGISVAIVLSVIVAIMFKAKD